MAASKDIEFIERFMKELILFRNTAKHRHLTARQWQVVKFKLYDTIFEMESRDNPIEETPQAEPKFSS